MRKTLIFVAAVLLLSTSLCYASAELTPSGVTKGNMRIVNLSVSRQNVSPEPVVVRPGEMVYLLVNSAEECKLTVPVFKIDKVIPAKKVTSVSFVSNKPGTFKVYCAFGRENTKARIVVLKSERKPK